MRYTVYTNKQPYISSYIDEDKPTTYFTAHSKDILHQQRPEAAA